MTKKLKSKHFIIPIEIYGSQVFVSINETNKVLKKQLKKFGVDPKGIFNEEPVCGKFIQFGNNHYLIRLLGFSKTPFHYGTLSHEILHVVIWMLDTMGMKVSSYSDEAYTYLMGFITKKIYEQI